MKSAREITELDIHMEGRVPTDKVSPKICLDTIPPPANLIRKRLQRTQGVDCVVSLVTWLIFVLSWCRVPFSM